jgi:hypothetical protein
VSEETKLTYTKIITIADPPNNQGEIVSYHRICGKPSVMGDRHPGQAVQISRKKDSKTDSCCAQPMATQPKSGRSRRRRE